jgi:hypothetical protein
MDWAEYLRGANRVEFADLCAYRKYMALADSLAKAFAFNFGDLRYKNVAKQIVKERTQPIAVSRGYAPWSFRFQCLLTGRKSKFIKTEEYYLFGITKSDMLDGGHYSEVADIEDKMQPVRDRLMSQLTSLRDKAFSKTSSGDWWLRYSEYLRSEEWFSIREAVLIRDGHKCRITGDSRDLQVHHLTYRNVGNENLSELVTLCKNVHLVVHDTRNPLYPRYISKLESITEAA